MRLIDADALEERMNNQYKYLAGKISEYDHYTCGYGDAISDVEDAPTIEAEPVRHGKWISVKERLPEIGGKYIVCTSNPSVYLTRFIKLCEGGAFQTDIYPYITHWMPLPEPPKEEKDGTCT